MRGAPQLDIVGGMGTAKSECFHVMELDAPRGLAAAPHRASGPIAVAARYQGTAKPRALLRRRADERPPRARP